MLMRLLQNEIGWLACIKEAAPLEAGAGTRGGGTGTTVGAAGVSLLFLGAIGSRCVVSTVKCNLNTLARDRCK
jgi:hypothetical protein